MFNKTAEIAEGNLQKDPLEQARGGMSYGPPDKAV
jgi:hypothetical protein